MTGLPEVTPSCVSIQRNIIPEKIMTATDGLSTLTR